MIYKCRTCGFYDSKQLVCQLTRSQGWNPQDYCSKHQQKTDITCDKCGHSVQASIIDDSRILCPECNQKLNTCFFCSWINHCAFDEDVTLPKTVQQKIQNGSQIFITEVRNPELEKKTCHQCKCYDTENSVCTRNIGNYCKNYEEEK